MIFCFLNLTTNDEFCSMQGFMVQVLNVATSIAAWPINCLTYTLLCLLSYLGTALWARICTSFSHCKQLINKIEWLWSLQENINAKACSREENKSLLKYFPRNLQNPRETWKKYLTNEMTLSSPPVRLAEMRRSKPRDAHASMGRAC